MAYNVVHVPGQQCWCPKCVQLRERKRVQEAAWKVAVITLAPRCGNNGVPEWLYHGTSITSASAMLGGQGVSLPHKRNKRPSPGQFSHQGAFYLTDSPEAAAEYAAKYHQHCVVLKFRYNPTGLRITHFRDGSWWGFAAYFIFSMVNFGHDVTTIFEPWVLKQLGLSVNMGRGRVRAMTFQELRRAAEKRVERCDMFTGPMLGVLSRDIWQYAITSQRGLSRLGRPRLHWCFEAP
ncbi:hypothetical protein C8R43DRAFT_1105407 [Mycena crocata]|nr:hypothetical protein C8R43DRAFT_1105407 [Mycena crocata]